MQKLVFSRQATAKSSTVCMKVGEFSEFFIHAVTEITTSVDMSHRRLRCQEGLLTRNKSKPCTNKIFSWSPVDHCFINFNTRTEQSHLSIWRPRIFLLHWINATWLASRTMELMRCSIEDSQSSHDAYQLASGYGRLVQRWMLMKELSIPEKLKESSQWQRRKFSAYFQWGCYSSFYWLQRAVAVTVFLYFLIGIS